MIWISTRTCAGVANWKNCYVLQTHLTRSIKRWKLWFYKIIIRKKKVKKKREMKRKRTSPSARDPCAIKSSGISHYDVKQTLARPQNNALINTACVLSESEFNEGTPWLSCVLINSRIFSECSLLLSPKIKKRLSLPKSFCFFFSPKVAIKSFKFTYPTTPPLRKNKKQMQRVFLEEQLIDFKITLFPSGEAEPSTTLTENILSRTFVAGYFLSVLVWTS